MRFDIQKDNIQKLKNLDIEIELMKQNKEQFYVPFLPTLEQKALFVNDNLTDLQPQDLEKKSTEIQDEFKKNVISLSNSIIANQIINNELFKVGINKPGLNNQFLINSQWIKFKKEITEKFSNVDISGFIEFSKVFLTNNNSIVLNKQIDKNELIRLYYDLIKRVEKMKDDNKIMGNRLYNEKQNEGLDSFNKTLNDIKIMTPNNINNLVDIQNMVNNKYEAYRQSLKDVEDDEKDFNKLLADHKDKNPNIYRKKKDTDNVVQAKSFVQYLGKKKEAQDLIIQAQETIKQETEYTKQLLILDKEEKEKEIQNLKASKFINLLQDPNYKTDKEKRKETRNYLQQQKLIDENKINQNNMKIEQLEKEQSEQLEKNKKDAEVNFTLDEKKKFNQLYITIMEKMEKIKQQLTLEFNTQLQQQKETSQKETSQILDKNFVSPESKITDKKYPIDNDYDDDDQQTIAEFNIDDSKDLQIQELKQKNTESQQKIYDRDIATFVKDIELLENKIDGKKITIDATEISINKLESEIKQVQSDIDKMKTNEYIYELESSIDNLNESGVVNEIKTNPHYYPKFETQYLTQVKKQLKSNTDILSMKKNMIESKKKFKNKELSDLNIKKNKELSDLNIKNNGNIVYYNKKIDLLENKQKEYDEYKKKNNKVGTGLKKKIIKKIILGEIKVGTGFKKKTKSIQKQIYAGEIMAGNNNDNIKRKLIKLKY